MLNQETLTDGVCPCFHEEFSYTIQLVVTRPDDFLNRLGFTLFFFLDNLGIVLQNVSKRILSEDFLPKVFGQNLGSFPRIASASIHALVERKEPTVLTLQLRAHPDLVIIHSKVDSTTTRSKEWICCWPVILILFDGILIVLPCVMVLQFCGYDRETVKKDTDIQSVHRLIRRVVKLAGNAEDVLLVEVQSRWIHL